MKKLLTLLMIAAMAINMQAQDYIKGREVYRIKLISEPYFKVNDTVRVNLPKGSTISVTLLDGTITSMILEKDSVVLRAKPRKVPVDDYIDYTYKVGEITHSDDKPGLLVLNPWNWDTTQLAPKSREDDIKRVKDLNTKHYIDIKPNEAVGMWNNSWDYGALTIPFAIRPALNDTTKATVTTDLNAAFFIRRSWNYQTFKNRRIKAKSSSKGVSMGLVVGFGQVTLTPQNTDLDNNPLTSNRDGMSIFAGPAIAFNLFGAQLAVAYAWDFGIGADSRKWNYHKEGFVGIGLGIGLGAFN